MSFCNRKEKGRLDKRTNEWLCGQKFDEKHGSKQIKKTILLEICWLKVCLCQSGKSESKNVTTTDTLVKASSQPVLQVSVN